MIYDKFTGKPVDRVSDRFPSPGDNVCETCGTQIINHCLRCGAPQCCPKCCAETTSQGKGE